MRPTGLSHRALGAVANMLVIAVAYGIFAVSLIVQPHRWSRTPAYHNLLLIMPQAAWGAVFAAVAALLIIGAPWWAAPRWVSILALTAAGAVTLGWGGSFVVRWLTSTSTTPETWVSWAVFGYVLTRAALLLDDTQPPGIPPPPPQPGPGSDARP